MNFFITIYFYFQKGIIKSKVFDHNHSLAFTLDILQFNFKELLNLDLENLGLPSWSQITFMIYWTWTRKIFENLTGLGLIYLSD